MHVADKVDQVPYSFGALHRVSRLVLQESALLLDRERDTACSAAIFVQRALMLPQRNVNIVPWTIVAFPHQRLSFGSMGLSARIFCTICRASGVRRFSAIKATV